MTGKSRQEEAPDENGVETEEPAAGDTADALAEANLRAEQYLDMARRLQADFDNYRKRSQREFEEYKKYASASVVSDLLTVLDDLDRALEQAGEETEFVKGIRGVRTNLAKVLESNGLQEIPAGGRFDPNIQEALCTVEGEEDGLVAEVLQKGYLLGGKVLRTSKVKVTKKAVERAGEQECQE